ncbi:MAG: tryptophan 2,3-dioxygenase [Planctomycetota bacterium]|nr:MAG: tryptophan 2,3-dioxygenase [Planctomycetota bacterium]
MNIQKPTPKPTNYWEYIRVEELLALQGGLAGDAAKLSNDEVMFITVHQVYELWFQLIRRELTSVRDLLRADPVAEQELSNAVAAMRRVVAILRVAIDHFEVMETLSTREYLSFRDKLMPASGFQSAQLRQIEILLGLDAAERIPYGLDENYTEALRAHDGGESAALKRVRAQLADRPTLKEALEDWLWRTPIDGCGPRDAGAEQSLERFVAAFLAAQAGEVDGSCEIALERSRSEDDRARLRARYEQEKASVRAFFARGTTSESARTQRIRAAMLFIATYRELPLLAWPRELLDTVIELEQVLTIWRGRHARMVERVIGRRTGTGGSAGVDYLDQTALRYRVFRDLWAIRTLQVRKESAPPLQHADFYGFRNG